MYHAQVRGGSRRVRLSRRLYQPNSKYHDGRLLFRTASLREHDIRCAGGLNFWWDGALLLLTPPNSVQQPNTNAPTRMHDHLALARRTGLERTNLIFDQSVHALHILSACVQVRMSSSHLSWIDCTLIKFSRWFRCARRCASRSLTWVVHTCAEERRDHRWERGGLLPSSESGRFPLQLYITVF